MFRCSGAGIGRWSLKVKYRVGSNRQGRQGCLERNDYVLVDQEVQAVEEDGEEEWE